MQTEGPRKSHNLGKKKQKEKSPRESRIDNRAMPDNDVENEVENDVENEVEYEHIIDIPIVPEDEEPLTKQLTGNRNQLSNGQAAMLEETASDKSGWKKTDDFLSVESRALDVDVIITDNSDLDFARSKRQRALIREAFADDAVLEEFAEEKEKQKEKRMPKDVDLTLPGWGEWAGGSIDSEKILNRKRKKFLKKRKRNPPSKDEHLKHVIINECKNKRFMANQVIFLYLSNLHFLTKSISHNFPFRFCFLCFIQLFIINFFLPCLIFFPF